MAKPAARTEQPERRQVAALPWRRSADGGVEILLITSRVTRRWVTPKGGRMSGKTDADVVEGRELALRLEAWFSDPAASAIHLHTARRGCFMAAAERA